MRYTRSFLTFIPDEKRSSAAGSVRWCVHLLSFPDCDRADVDLQGIGALFISTLAIERLPTPVLPPESSLDVLALTIQPVTYFIVLCSIIAHGASPPLLFLAYESRSRRTRPLDPLLYPFKTSSLHLSNLYAKLSSRRPILAYSRPPRRRSSRYRSQPRRREGVEHRSRERREARRRRFGRRCR